MTRVPISCPNTTTTTTASTTTTTTILTCTQEQTEQSSQLQTKHKSDNNNNNNTNNNNNNKHSNNNHKRMKNHIDHNNNNNNNDNNNNNNNKSNHHHHYNNRHYYKMSPLFRALVMIFCLLVALFQSYAPMRYKILCSIFHMIYFFIDDNIVSIVLFLITRKSLLDDNRTCNRTKQSNEEEENSQNKSKNTFSSRSGSMMNNNHGRGQKQSEKQQRMNETVWKLYCLPPNCQINMLHIHLIRSLYLALLPLYSYAFLGIEAPVWLACFVFQQSLAVNLSTVTDAHWSLILIVVSSHFVATVVGMFCIAPRFSGPSYSLYNVISPLACLICSMVMMIRICEFMKQIATREREDEKHATFVHSEIMYRKMYRDAPCLFITVNRAGVILNCNTAVQKLTCRSEDALIGSVFYSLLTPESQAALRNVLVICGTTNTKKDVVINNIELEMKGGYVNMIVDSDRSLLSSGGSGDDEEETTASSTSGSSSLGHSDERRNKNKDDDKTLTRDNYMIHHMLASITKTYQRSINSMDNNGPMELVYNIVLQDMSENNMTQHQLKVAKEQAEEANRTKSMFLNSMSHELRTPLTAIVGLSEILLMDKRLIDEQLDVVKSISRSSVVLRTLISDILDLSKIEAGRCQLEHYRFDLKSALETVDRLTRTSALEKQLEYKFEVAGNVPTRLMGDAMRLNQVLLNLCNNCIKFTHKGSVTVSVTSDHNSLSPYMQSQLPKHHSNNPNQTQLFFSVSDTGIGIPARKMRELFQPFTQVQAFETRFTGGTGLGLYISKSLVQLMKGHIAVASKEGFGSTFTFSMVLGIDNAQLDETIVESPSELLGPCLDNCPSDNLPRDLRVLVTDDNLINQRVLSKTLQSLGVPLDNIQFASDGRSAVDTYHNSSGNIDLIFMDLHMPIMNGFEATQIIRKVDSKTIIVCLTANATDQAKQKCESAGFSHYLSKPYTRTQIADILNRVKSPVV